MCSCESAQFWHLPHYKTTLVTWSSLSYRHLISPRFVRSLTSLIDLVFFWIFCKARLLGFVALSHFAMSLFSGDNELLSIHIHHIHVGRCFRNCENFDLVTCSFLEPVFSPRIGNILQQAARSSVFDTPHADWWFWKPRWSWNLLRWTRSGRPMSRSLGLPIKCHSMSLIFVDFVDPGIWHCMLAFMTLICASF